MNKEECKDESAAITRALHEKRISDLEQWRTEKEKHSSKITWGIFGTVITTLGFILSKAWGKIFP